MPPNGAMPLSVFPKRHLAREWRRQWKGLIHSLHDTLLLGRPVQNNKGSACLYSASPDNSITVAADVAKYAIVYSIITLSSLKVDL
jgi:hypothetical protein